MPSSVTDRLTNRWEPVLMFAKSARYEFDLDAIRKEQQTAGQRHEGRSCGSGSGWPNQWGARARQLNPKGGNPGDFWEIEHDPFDEWWSIPVTPYPGTHFAVYPVRLPMRAIQTTRPDAVVLDPFSGSGTTGEACRRLGRRYIGIDLNPAYHDLAVKRYAQGTLESDLFGGVAS
jgi:site-specific DNA-methyltransferase (cytosine-N4-specific)